MNKPHKWAKEITHYINGGEVEYRYTDDYLNRNKFSAPYNYDLLSENNLEQFERGIFIFRIKPKKKTMKVAVFKNPFGDVYVNNADCDTTTLVQLSGVIEIEYEDEQS